MNATLARPGVNAPGMGSEEPASPPGPLRRLLSIGIREDTPAPEAKRVWLTNVLAIGSISMCLPALVYGATAATAATALLAVSVLVFATILPLNHFGRYRAARLVFVGVGQIMIIASCAEYGQASYVHLTVICSLAVTWVMFQPDDKVGLIFGNGIAVITGVALELGLGDLIGGPVPVSASMAEVMRMTNLLSILSIVTLSLGVMSAANRRQEKDLRQALADLSDRELSLSAIMRHAAAALVSTNTQGVILSVNNEAEKMFGRSTFELVGQQIRTLVPGFFVGSHECESVARSADGSEIPVHVALRCVGTNGDRRVIGVLRDLTREREHEQALRELAELSRTAGMAEVATDVIHNIGNVLNSVVTNASVAADLVEAQSPEKYEKLADLLGGLSPDEAPWLAAHPHGTKVVPYLRAVAKRVECDKGQILDELRSLRSHVEHIKRIVQAQQELAAGPGIMDRIVPSALLDEVMVPFERGLSQIDAAIIRDYSDTPAIIVDRHRLLQILVNLVKNAKEAMQESPSGERHELVLGVHPSELGVRFSVRDSGSGIAPGDLERVFQHGFTTKAHGHGFGLHGCAISATVMGGELHAASDGPGRGALFTLDLPLEPPRPEAEEDDS